jgi:hypothetical protein
VDTPNSGMLSLVEKNLVPINVKSLIRTLRSPGFGIIVR